VGARGDSGRILVTGVLYDRALSLLRRKWDGRYTSAVNEWSTNTGKENASMKVHKPDDIPAQPVNAPLFTGGPVTRQTLLTPEASNYFNLGIVNFSAGARNKMHTHSSDQVLFVTAGKGIIATETEQQIITPGDVVHIPSEEKHWHGATHDSAFSHIALTAKGSTTTQVEE
jgi:quercetin dioxygenase-like cupin family protein